MTRTAKTDATKPETPVLTLMYNDARTCHNAGMTATQGTQATAKNTPAYLAPIFGAFAVLTAIAPAITLLCWALAATAITLGIIGIAHGSRQGRATLGLALAVAALTLSIISLNM